MKLCISLFHSWTNFIPPPPTSPPPPLLLMLSSLRFNYFYKEPTRGLLIKSVHFQSVTLWDSLHTINFKVSFRKFPKEDITYYFLSKNRKAFGILSLKVNLKRESQIAATSLNVLFNFRGLIKFWSFQFTLKKW